MSLRRTIEPEWLDQVAADDPRAIRHRRDLKRLNAVILQTGIMADALARYWSGPDSPRRILDLGTGDGTFMLSVARQLAPRWRGVAVTLLDQQDIVSAETRRAFDDLGWKAEPAPADVLDYLGRSDRPPTDIVTANLFLHHFHEAELTRLLALAARSTKLFVACEPHRTKFVLNASRLTWMLGCGETAVRDAILSVRAGFADRELAALWPKQGQWELHEGSARLFTHRFVARSVGSTTTTAA